jgi:hypothetical protein
VRVRNSSGEGSEAAAPELRSAVPGVLGRQTTPIADATGTALFGGLTPADAARRSHEAQRRKRDLSPEERAAEAARTAAPELVKELLDAALGRGDFKTIKPEDRLKALTRALEYGIGRPGVARREDGTPTDIPSAADLFGSAAPPEEDLD